MNVLFHVLKYLFVQVQMQLLVFRYLQLKWQNRECSISTLQSHAPLFVTLTFISINLFQCFGKSNYFQMKELYLCSLLLRIENHFTKRFNCAVCLLSSVLCRWADSSRGTVRVNYSYALRAGRHVVSFVYRHYSTSNGVGNVKIYVFICYFSFSSLRNKISSTWQNCLMQHIFLFFFFVILESYVFRSTWRRSYRVCCMSGWNVQVLF
jgi:hypothetical protein